MYSTAITSLGLALLMGTATALQVNWYPFLPPFSASTTARTHAAVENEE